MGYDLKAFKRYFETLVDLHEYYRSLGLRDEGLRDLGETEEKIVQANPYRLIVWLEDDEIVGHVIWHESNTDEHRVGDPRDVEDKRLLRELLGGMKDFVELHELWLRTAHRGKGYGKEFFEFIEKFIRKQGHDSIIYYTDNPAAIAICRKRGYKEAFLKKEKWYIFHLVLNKNPI